MVRVCCFPGCFNRCKRFLLRPENLTFHRLPLSDPYRLPQWLAVLRLDLTTPRRRLNALRICSEHFPLEDFTLTPMGRSYLKSTAVPMTTLGLQEHSVKSEPDDIQIDAGEQTSTAGTQMPIDTLKEDVKSEDISITIETPIRSSKPAKRPRPDPTCNPEDSLTDSSEPLAPAQHAVDEEAFLRLMKNCPAGMSRLQISLVRLPPVKSEPDDTQTDSLQTSTADTKPSIETLEEDEESEDISTTTETPIRSSKPAKRPRPDPTNNPEDSLIDLTESSEPFRAPAQHLVDEEAILQLLKNCPVCDKTTRCRKLTRGPFFIVYQSCYFCHYHRKWANQPEARLIEAGIIKPQNEYKRPKRKPPHNPKPKPNPKDKVAKKAKADIPKRSVPRRPVRVRRSALSAELYVL